MEMTEAYLDKAARVLEARGYALSIEERRYGDGSEGAIGTVFTLRRSEREALVLEHVRSPSAPTRYYIEVVNHFGIRAYPFGLESWKVHSDRIEWKLEGEDDSRLAFAFVLSLPEEVRPTDAAR
jgi:hypothetical protein